MLGGEKLITQGIVGEKKSGVVSKEGPNKGDAYYVVKVDFVGGSREFFFFARDRDKFESFPDEGSTVECISKVSLDNRGNMRTDFAKVTDLDGSVGIVAEDGGRKRVPTSRERAAG